MDEFKNLKHTRDSIAEIAAQCRSDKEFRQCGKGIGSKDASSGSPWSTAQKIKRDDPDWYATITAHFVREIPPPSLTYAVALPIAQQCPDRKAWKQTTTFQSLQRRAHNQSKNPSIHQEAQAILDEIDSQMCWLLDDEYDAASIILSVVNSTGSFKAWKKKHKPYTRYLQRIGLLDWIEEFFELTKRLAEFHRDFSAIIVLQDCKSVSEAKGLRAYNVLQRAGLLPFGLRGIPRDCPIKTHTEETIWRSVLCSQSKPIWQKSFGGQAQAAYKMKTLMAKINDKFGATPNVPSDSAYYWQVDTDIRLDGRILIKVGISTFDRKFARWDAVQLIQNIRECDGVIFKIDLQRLAERYPDIAERDKPVAAFEAQVLKTEFGWVIQDNDPVIRKLVKGGHQEFRWVTPEELDRLKELLQSLASETQKRSPKGRKNDRL